MCSQRGLFDLKNEKYVVSLSEQDSALCHGQDCYLKVSTGGKVQVFNLFLLLFLSGSVNRRLAVNI